MSHTTRLKGCNINDAAAVRSAVKDLQKKGVQIELKTNTKPRMYYGNQGEKCEFVLSLTGGQYDVGLKKQKDGSYTPMFDEWGRHVSGQIGAACPMPNTSEGRAQHAIGQFLQHYAVHATQNAARKDGHMVEGVTTDKDGNMHVNIVAAAA